MKLSIRVVTRSSRDFVKEDSGILKVYVSKPPADGLANEAVIRLLSDHFNVSKSRVSIVGGARSKNKIVQID